MPKVPSQQTYQKHQAVSIIVMLHLKLTPYRT